MLRITYRTYTDGFAVRFAASGEGSDWEFGESREMLKEIIPNYARKWDRSSGHWLIVRSAERLFRRWLCQMQQQFDAVIIGDDDEPTASGHQRTYRKRDWSPEPRQLSPYQKLCLTPDAPIELVRAAKRALALLYHPDRATGDLGKTQAINAAADEIEKGQAA